MTIPELDVDASDRTPAWRWRRRVLESVPVHSRRDMIRAAAVTAAAAGFTPAVAAAWTPGQGTTHHALAAQTATDLAIPFVPFGQDVVLDPHRAPNWGPFWVLLPHVWAGLLAFDENGAVVNDLAASVTPNETADVWTATLQPNLTFASGSPVTAQSFVDSWLRALNPERPAPMASFMDAVSGYDAYIAGESTDIGFAVVDDSTIEITLAEPWSSFPSALATFVWAAVDSAALDDPEVPDPALAGASAGAWQFTELVDGDHITMEPNPASHVGASPSIARVVWRILEGPDAATNALRLYQADELALADIPASLQASASSDETLNAELVSIASQSSTMAIGMDFNQPPFGDVRVRQAIAAAIDVQAWANEIWGGEFVPATSIVPPVVSLTSGYEPVAPLPFDAEQSRSLLQDAEIDPEQSAPDIVYHQPASDSPDTIERHAALLGMIQENSGLTVRQDLSMTADQIAALQGDNGGRQFDIVWWWTVTDTADLLRTIGQSTSPLMSGWFNWSPDLEGIAGEGVAEASTQFDELIATANQSVDADERNSAYQQAEELLVQNAVYIPLGHWVQRFVQKPWLQGTRQGPWSGSTPVRFDTEVVLTDPTAT